MWMKKLFFSLVLLGSSWAHAQTAWPLVQSTMYPYIDQMKLVRHEQTVLLGEGNQQTGIFYASLPNTYSEQVSGELVNDAFLKNWTLHSLVRLGTSYVLTFVHDSRILDVRLINTAQGVDAIYSVVLYQSNNKIKVAARGSSNDATLLDRYLKFEWTHDNSNLQMVCSIDQTGSGRYSKLFTMTDLISSVGSGTYNNAQADMSLLSGTESTSNAILQKLLEEGRMVIQ